MILFEFCSKPEYCPSQTFFLLVYILILLGFPHFISFFLFTRFIFFSIIPQPIDNICILKELLKGSF